MKKVYLILALLMTSFFFVSSNEVRAAETTTYTYDILDSDFDYLTEDFFKCRQLAINYAHENNKKYVISLSGARFIVRFFDEDISGSTYYVRKQNMIPAINLPKDLGFRYNSSSETLESYTISSNSIYPSLQGSTITPELFSLSTFMDTNLDYIPYNFTDVIYIFNYKNLSYKIMDGFFPPTLYQVYLDSNSPFEDVKFNEEKVLINNFYSTIFTEISELTTNLSNNYTFLLIFSIFILIFVIELIRRCFL